MRKRTGHSSQGYDGEPSYGYLGQASSFAKATEDKDARPSRALYTANFLWARRRGRPPSLKLRRDKETHPPMTAAACVSPRPSSPLFRTLALLAPLAPLAFCTFPWAHWPSILLRQGYGRLGPGHAVAMACFSAVHSRSSRPTTIAEAVDKEFCLYCLSTYPVDFCNRN